MDAVEEKLAEKMAAAADAEVASDEDVGDDIEHQEQLGLGVSAPWVDDAVLSTPPRATNQDILPLTESRVCLVSVLAITDGAHARRTSEQRYTQRKEPSVRVCVSRMPHDRTFESAACIERQTAPRHTTTGARNGPGAGCDVDGDRCPPSHHPPAPCLPRISTPITVHVQSPLSELHEDQGES